jgi:hypothetical protein
MRKIHTLVWVAGLLAACPLYSQVRLPATSHGVAAHGIISLCQDPNCAGCRTFLASYGNGGPSCSCETAPSVDSEAAALGEDLLAADYGTGYGFETAAPNMIGDFFGGGYTFGTPFPDRRGPSLPIAGGDRRFKVADNVSPFPRDRVYVNYNRFSNAVVTIEGDELDLHRYTVGAEKTFWDGMASIEFRAPFASALNSDQTLDGNQANDSNTEFGNVTLAPKIVLLARDTFLLSTGLGINLPSAEDGSFSDGSDTTLIQNRAVHLMPFLGLVVTPTDATYVMSYVQADFDVNGYPVLFNGIDVGRLQEQSLLHLDLAIGHWIYRNTSGRITGIAPQLEIHYSTNMQDPDAVAGITNPAGRIDTLALTGGVNVHFFNLSTLTVAAVAPLTGNDDINERQYDAELQIFFNRDF